MTIIPGIKDKYIQIEESKIHYLESGNGMDTVLFIHAFPVGAMMWDNVIPYIAQQYHILAPDLPGYGYSEMMQKPHISENYAVFLNNFLNKLKVDKVHLVGYSYGSIVSTRFTIKFPEKIKSVVIGAMPVYHKDFLPSGATKIFNTLDKNPKIEKTFHLWNRSKLNKYITLLAKPRLLGKVGRKKLNYYFNCFSSYKDHAIRDTLEELVTLDLRDDIKSIKVPSLLILGDEDVRVKVSHAERISKVIKNSRIKIIPKSDHALPAEKPIEFAASLLEFWDTLG